MTQAPETNNLAAGAPCSDGQSIAAEPLSLGRRRRLRGAREPRRAARAFGDLCAVVRRLCRRHLLRVRLPRHPGRLDRLRCRRLAQAALPPLRHGQRVPRRGAGRAHLLPRRVAALPRRRPIRPGVRHLHGQFCHGVVGQRHLPGERRGPRVLRRRLRPRGRLRGVAARFQAVRHVRRRRPGRQPRGDHRGHAVRLWHRGRGLRDGGVLHWVRRSRRGVYCGVLPDERGAVIPLRRSEHVVDFRKPAHAPTGMTCS
ncbi:hypothetical protein DFJ74DRAFT_763232 [Hyaloraphidium curvatum]|nr:hypothetical protein DFJ74DRAFT_763232 [Hyaloraphidium curvatum]